MTSVAGDVLRLGFFLALLIGGAREIRIAQRQLEQSPVLDERRSSSKTVQCSTSSSRSIDDAVAIWAIIDRDPC